MMFFLITSFYATWILFTVMLNLNLESRARWFLRIILHIEELVPRWTFFAPTPGVDDYCLVYREISPSGTSVWRTAVDNRAEKVNYCTRAFWNPQARKKKVLLDIVTSLGQLQQGPDGSKKEPSDLMQFSIPYLLVLNYITDLPHEPGASKIQFMILAVSAPNAMRPLLLSSIHQL